MAKGYVIDGELLRAVRRIVQRELGTRINTPVRPSAELGYTEGVDYLSPETYIARPVNSTGIPALTKDAVEGGLHDTPGHALCNIFQITPSGSLYATGFTETVYNLQESDIPQEWVPVTRTKQGEWIALKSSSSPLVIVRFQILSAVEAGGVVESATAEIMNVAHGVTSPAVGDTITVIDGTGCYFSGETAAELVDRMGWAIKMESGDPYDEEGIYEVMNLCCAP